MTPSTPHGETTALTTMKNKIITTVAARRRAQQGEATIP